MSICWLHLFLAIISHQRAGDGLRMITSLTMIMMALVMLQGDGGDDDHVEAGGQMLGGIAGARWHQLLWIKSQSGRLAALHTCAHCNMLDCTLCIIHCKLATLSRRQKPTLPGRRYRSMSPVGRQSLQFYNEYIKW